MSSWLWQAEIGLHCALNWSSATGSSVVFVRTKHSADRVAQRLRSAGTAAAAIHGDRRQSERERTLAAFRAGRLQALVATDVAARGIHVDDVARVIHYDLPPDIKDYVHRSGRTARAGSGGTVIAFVTPEQRPLASTLQRGLALAGHTAEVPASNTSKYAKRPKTGDPEAAKFSGRLEQERTSGAARRSRSGNKTDLSTGRVYRPTSQSGHRGRINRPARSGGTWSR